MKKAQAELEQVGIHLDLRRTMDDLALAERQLVEIAKVLAFNARIIILDEPTAALNEVDAGKLLELLSQLKQQGRVIIYVSHRLDESFILAERLMVLRNGEVVLDTPTENVVPDDVISAMLGKPQIASVSRSSSQAVASTRTIRESPTEAAYAAPVLRVLSWRTEGAMHLDNVSFDMYQGEILGLFGLVGSGVELVARGLAGQEGSIRGQLEVRGHRRKPFRHPHEARRTGIGYVPAERKSDGIALNQTVKDNLLVLVLSEVASLGIVHSRAEANRAKQFAAEFFVHYSHIREPVCDLSGGNQQKILLASRLAPVPKILVLNEPTRGVDIGARAQIHEILQHALRGASILLATSDLAEAVSLSDRLLVMRDGRIVQELVGQAKTQERALAIATRAA
jgi:ABC-type sugar transport system ATPase subunit